MSLSARVALGVVAIIALSTLGLMTLLSSHDRDRFVADRHVLLAATADSDAARLRQQIGNLRKSILFLANTPPVQGIVRATRNKGVDPRDGDTLGKWKNRLGEIFSAYVEAHSEYLQIRYIGVEDFGREIVRVDLRDGHTVAVPPEQLQQKGDRDYFQAALKLKAGAVHLSNINLNQEHGTIQLPHTPVLRAATPVFGSDGAAFGIVVINIDFGYLARSLAPNLGREVAVRLANAAGDYLVHPEASRSFGFDLGRRYRWQDELLGLQVQPSATTEPQTLLQRLPSAAGMVYAVARQVSIDSLRPESDLLLIYTFPETAVDEQVASARRRILIGVAVGGLLILLLLLWLVRRTFAPLIDLTRATQAIAAGRYQVPLPEGGTAELGTLVQSFRAMRESIALRDERNRAIVETTSDGFWMTDEDGHILDVNDAYARLSGYTREELLSMRAVDLKTDQDPERFRLGTLEIMRAGFSRFESEHRRKDGTTWPLEVTATWSPSGGGRLFVFLRDITQRRTAERERSKRESLLRSVMDSLDSGIAVLNAQGLIIAVNNGWRNFAVVNAAADGSALLLGRVGLDYLAACRAAAVSDPSAAEALAGLEAVRDGRLATFRLEYPCHGPEIQRWFIMTVRPLAGADQGLVISHFDITERKQQEQEIHRLLTENETILSNALVGIVYLKQRLIVSCNRRLEEIFQYDPGELIGETTERLYDSRETFDHIGVAAYRDAAQGQGYTAEVGLRHKDGSLFWGALSGRAVDPARPHDGSIWIYADISERKRAESMIQRDREQQELLRRLLEIVLVGDGVESSLKRVLDVLLSASWLSLLPKGGVFRMEEDGSGLRLVVAHDLPPEILHLCARVPLGHCHCGRAAASGELQYAAQVDAGHDGAYPDMTDHGHYCVPIMSGSRKLGVLMLYLPVGTPRDASREKFLAAVAGILAGYLLRTEAEQALLDHKRKLEETVKLRTEKLQASEARSRAVLTTMLDGVVHIDAQGIMLSVNHAVLDMFGYEERDLIGSNVSMLMPEPHASAHDGYLGRYARTRQTHVVGTRREIEGRCKDGSLLPIELAVNEMADALGSTFIGVIRDMTAQRAAEHELKAALGTAQVATAAKSRFLADMSHEIRTPMNGVIGMLEVLRETSLRGHQMEIVDTMRESAFSLMGIIEDILDFSKIEAGKMEVASAPISVADAVQKACAMLDVLAARNNVELTLFTDPALPALVLGDAQRLRQVVINLVNNAIKFSAGLEQQGRVSVRAELAKRGDGPPVAEIRVTDNGIGMDDATLARLFTAFTQGDATNTQRFGGTGLGLAIAHKMVELMGGEIEVLSVPDAGSTFIVRLPCLPVEGGVGDNAAAFSVAGLRCLAVGARGGLADDWAVYLSAAGARVERASELAAARERCAALPAATPGPWIWLLDAGAAPPAPDGLRAIAGAAPAQDIRFVIVSRGKRRQARHYDEGRCVEVDANILMRQGLLRAVAMAAGRVSEEAGQGPATAGPRAPLTPPTRAEALRRGQLILVAEDNEINRKVIVRQLALLGFAADLAEDGSEALQRWESGDYALLLTDLNMPNMDGYELADAIRTRENDRGARRIPVVALTANALESELQRCLATGMDGYLSKPVLLANLKAVLNKWLPTAAVGSAVTAAQDAVSPAPTLAPVDVGVLAALVGDDPATIGEFLLNFRNSAATIGAELCAACAAGQAARAGALAHKLKSSARSVGAMALGDLCDKMEQAGAAGDSATLAALLPEFEEELIAVDEHLNSLPIHGAPADIADRMS